MLSPAPNRAKLLSENKGLSLTERTENYKAPQLRALDSKLKNIMNEKKSRLMNKMRSPLKQVSSHQNLVGLHTTLVMSKQLIAWIMRE